MARQRHEILRQVGANLRSLRRERDLTQQDVAERAKVSVNYVSEVERGLRNPSVLTLARIAKAGLGVELTELLHPPLAGGGPRPGSLSTYPEAGRLPALASMAADGQTPVVAGAQRRLARLVTGWPSPQRRRLRVLLRLLAELFR